MFLFLFLSSRSMMKCCVLSGSMIRLGIVLLSPHSQGLGPAHAAAVIHFGGFPPMTRLFIPRFPVAMVGAAGIHQQLSPEWRGSTPSSSFSCSSSPSTSVKNNTYSHCAACMPLCSWCITPYLVPQLIFFSFCCYCSFPPAKWTPAISSVCAVCVCAVLTLFLISQRRCKLL